MSEKMSLFEKLSEKFETKNIPPYGAAVIIPCKDFAAGWKEQLLNEGVKIFSNSYFGQTCFFIRKSKVENSIESTIHEESMSKEDETDGKSSKATIKKPWSQRDRTLLLDLYKKGSSGNEIAEKLGRTFQEIGAYIRHNISDEMKILRKSKLEATDKGSHSVVNSSKPEKPKRKRGIPFTPEEQEEFEKLCDQDFTAKQIAKKMGKSVFQVAPKLRHFRKTKDPEKPIEPEEPDSNPENPSLLKELLAGSLQLLDSNKIQAAKVLLNESIQMLGDAENNLRLNQHSNGDE